VRGGSYSLIIVDYRSINKTIHYIEHFASMVKGEYPLHAVIVDNSPSQDVDKAFACYSKKDLIVIDDLIGYTTYVWGNLTISYCFAGNNLGYAKGNNLGVKIADLCFNDNFYIISNNDLRLDEKFDWCPFERLFEENQDIAVIGPRVVGLDGKVQSPHKKVSAFSHLVLSFWLGHWPFYWRCDCDYTEESKYCYRVMGSFMIIRACAFHKADGFDENTFMFGEEMILSERLSRNGYKTYFFNDYAVVHEHGASVKRVDSVLRAEQWSFDSIYYYYEKYRNTNSLILVLGKISFYVYKAVRYVVNCIKHMRYK